MVVEYGHKKEVSKGQDVEPELVPKDETPQPLTPEPVNQSQPESPDPQAAEESEPDSQAAEEPEPEPEPEEPEPEEPEPDSQAAEEPEPEESEEPEPPQSLSPQPITPSEPEINISPNIKSLWHFRNEIWNRFETKKDRELLGSMVFRSFFDYWLQFKKRDRTDEFEWKITRDFFESDEKWDLYVGRNANRKKHFGNSYEELGYFQFEPTRIKWLSLKFEFFYDSHIAVKDSYDSRLDDKEEFDMGDDLSGFYTVKEFKEKYPHTKIEKKYKVIKGKAVEVDENSVYVPKESITSAIMTEMVNLTSPEIPVFANNPLLEVSKAYSENEMNKLERFKVKIMGRIDITSKGVSNKIVGSYSYECPVCNKKLEYKPFEMNKATISHPHCMRSLSSEGKPKKVPIDKAGYTEGPTHSLYYYEVRIYGLEGIEKESRYFSSFDPHIRAGTYYVDVANVNGKLSSPRDKERKPIMFGIERAKAKFLYDVIDREGGKKLAESFGCQPHKLFDIWASVIKYYREKQGIELDPKKGATLQIFLLISLISRGLFNFRNFSGSVIGETSISKTYVAKLLAKLLDPEFIFTSGKSQTYAGIYGGVNSERIINGKSVRIFEEGAMSKGTVVLDEAPHLYTEEEANRYMKDFLNEEMTIIKIGAKDINIRFTPYIFSNFFGYHKGSGEMKGFDMSYEGRIKYLYYKIIKDNEAWDVYHQDVDKITRPITDNYVSSFNLYRPLQYYENEYLREAIAMTRAEKINRDKCWWTGGDIASQNRLLFDCVVKANKVEGFINPFDKEFSPLGRSDNVSQYDLPTEDFLNTIIHYIKGDCEDEINLKRGFVMRSETKEQVNEEEYEPENSEYIRNKINALRKNIHIHLRDHKDVVLHFGDGRKLDDKTKDFIELAFFIIQKINIYDSLELDPSTIDLCTKILLKCKRGLTEDEYNFLDNSYRPNYAVIMDKNLQADVLTSKVKDLTSDDKTLEDIQKKLQEIEKDKDKNKVDVSKEKKESKDVAPIDFKFEPGEEK